MKKKRNRDTVRAAIIIKTARIVGVSERQVNRVLNGDQQNEEVVLVFMELSEGETKLVKEVRKLVPLN
ncbi:MAG: hypothetical protein Q8K66_04115 [Sediminibacterium sp.]|nr:hypothetical protein [Sediminibacterium sp.]MDP3128124.1 hypothetical protein [Sediminibacterium sp.]